MPEYESPAAGPEVVYKLAHPTPHIHIFKPTPDKVDLIVGKLLNEYLWMSDEQRDEEHIRRVFDGYVTTVGTIVYEVGNMDALIIFKNIIPGWKASTSLKIINPQFWNKGIVREFRSLLKIIMDTFTLVRMSTSTADERMVTIGRLVGFSEEGRLPKAFMWDKHLYDDILLSVVKED